MRLFSYASLILLATQLAVQIAVQLTIQLIPGQSQYALASYSSHPTHIGLKSQMNVEAGYGIYNGSQFFDTKGPKFSIGYGLSRLVEIRAGISKYTSVPSELSNAIDSQSTSLKIDAFEPSFSIDSSLRFYLALMNLRPFFELGIQKTDYIGFGESGGQEPNSISFTGGLGVTIGLSNSLGLNTQGQYVRAKPLDTVRDDWYFSSALRLRL